MRLKNFTCIKIIVTTVALIFLSFVMKGQTVIKTWNPGGSTCVDGNGNYGTAIGTVNFNAADFSGCNITELDVNIRWSKSDGTCPNPTGTGNSFHNETSFLIQGPTGAQVILVRPGAYSGGTSINYVITRFNQGSTAVSGTPSSGTFGPNNGNLNDFNGTNPVGTWTLFAGDNAGNDPLIIDYFQVIATSSGGQPSAQGFGCGQWNVNAYKGRDWDLGGGTTMYGYYTEPNLSFDTRNRWASNSTPATASGYVGCDPGTDQHTVVSKRTCFPCATYRIDVPNHDDETKLFIDGTQVWSHNGCCDSHTNVWTGVLDNSSTVEIRHAEGTGGSHHGLTFTDVTTALTPGSHNTTAITACVGYNPGSLGGSGFSGTNQEAAGGASTTVTGGTTTYQWQLNGTNIAGATGIAYNPPALNAAGSYAYTRIATDRCGDTATTSPKNITIVPDPTASLAGATTICPNETATITATFANGTGSCDNTWQSSPNNATWTTIVTNTSNTYTTPALATSMYYRVIRDCSGSGCTNATSNSVFIEVEDDTDPVIANCPGNVTVANTATLCTGIATWVAPTASDNCTSAPTLTLVSTHASGSSFPLGNTTVTYTADDGNGNTSTCSFVVTVNDTEDPQITCPANITANNDLSVCGAVVTYTTPSGTDNCPGQTTAQIAGLASGATFPIGVTTNTFEVTDDAGNTETCSFTVTVNDTEDPQITCPANITTNNDVNTCGAVVTYTAPSGTDNCPGQTTAQIAGLASGATFPVGITTNTFEVTDDAGNTETCSFTVTVNDNQDPVISCPANITMDNDLGVCGAVVTYTTPSGTDNCPGQTTNQTVGFASGATFPVGTTTNTFVVTDLAGNTATCSFTVTINDTEAPQITCPANITAVAAIGVCEVAVTYADPATSDNCPGQTTIQTAGLASGSNFPVGTTTNSFEVTDAAGNVATCSFDIDVSLDGVPLDFVVANPNVCLGDGILASQSGGSPIVGTNPGDTGTYSGLGVTDNSNGTYDFDPAATGIGVHSIAYTYFDGSGCTLFITKEIEVFESPIASLTCPDPIVKDCLSPFNCNPQDLNPTTVAIASGTISGSAAPFTYGDPNPGGDFFIDFPNIPVDTPLELIYTVTTTDGCTNSTTCTFEVTSKQADAGKY